MALEPPPTQAMAASGQASRFLQHLSPGLDSDDRLEVAHHAGIGVRAHGGTEHVEQVGVADKGVEGFVHGLLEGTLTAEGRSHFRAHHAPCGSR